MATAEELIVAIKSEGVSETQQDLEGVERTMEDTAESAGDSADELQGFSERFRGAMSAAVTALSIGAAGLLSQVPVLGEAFSGLAAIVEALAFQMDGVLRPVLSPLTDFFFELANAIFDADGIVGDLIGGITAFLSIASVLIAAVAAVGVQLGTWASIGAGVSSILGTIAGAIATVVGVIAGLPAALVVAAAALVAFVAAYLTNFMGVRDKTNKIVGQIIDFVVGGFMSLGTKALNAVTDFAGKVRTFFAGLASDISSWASDLASDAYEWGKGLIQGFINGIRSLISRVQNFLGDLQDVGASVGIDVPSLGGINGGGGTTGGGGGSSGRPLFRGGGGGGTTLDGRQLTESTGRYRSDPNRRRGL